MRQLPVDGEPSDVAAIVSSYADWPSEGRVPKLFISGEPEAVLTESRRAFCRTWPNQIEMTVPGLYFPQEDSPDAIGRVIVDWLKSLAWRLD